MRKPVRIATFFAQSAQAESRPKLMRFIVIIPARKMLIKFPLFQITLWVYWRKLMHTLLRTSFIIILLLTALLSGCQNQPNPPQATEEPYPLAEETQAPMPSPAQFETPAPAADEPYPGAAESVTPVAAAGEIEALIASLREAGASVELDGTISQSFFTPLGQIVRVNDQDVQVFVYTDEAAAQGAAAQVSPDGSAVGSEQVAWVATPHFFRQGKLIVLYVGDEATVLQILQSALGEQFAGR